MIARQRDLLRRTFAALELETAARQAPRLTQSQQEILDATQEFATGLALQAGPAPPLENAVTAMESAVASLGAADVAGGMPSEETALEELIKARQNLRQILRMSNSSAASQCRTFDRQQQQKLRPPEKKKDEPPPAISEMRSQIEQLAENQRKWSDEVRQGSPSAHVQSPQQRRQSQQPQPESPSQQSSSSQQFNSSQQANDSSQSLAERQTEAARRADELRRQLAESDAAGDLSERRMEQAAEAILSGLESLNQGQPQNAAEQASQAAEQLDRLSDHLANLNAADFAQRLARAQQAARELAERQHELAQQAGANRAAQQAGLADRGEELAERLARLGADAQEEDAEVRRLLSAAKDANPPQEIAQLMRGAAEDFAEGENARGVRSAEMAARSLDELAAGLQPAREAYAQPRLEELLAAEEHASRLLEELLNAASEGERAVTRSQIEELQETLERLAAGDPRLAEALEAMQNGGKQSSTSPPNSNPQRDTGGLGEPNGGRPQNTGLNHSDQIRGAGLRRTVQALQAKIQETILSGALLDPDQAVPPEYQKMVEEYYRALSEDLRE